MSIVAIYPQKKFKEKSITVEQKQVLVLFTQEHPELWKGKFSLLFTLKQYIIYYFKSNYIALQNNKL